MSWVGFSLASPITRRTAFTCVIFTGDLKNFETVGEPTEYYLKKKVTVSGIVKIYEGRPEIILKNPSQIVIQK
jgi:DNA/RNA endonuclease YhcR with UshA esterase domain